MTSVTTTENGQYQFDFADYRPLGHEVVRALHDERIDTPYRHQNARRQLQRLRMAATELHQSDDPDDAMVRESIDDRFKYDNLSSRRDEPAFTRTSRIVGWLSRAPYSELQTFCEWNVDRANRLQVTVDKDTKTIRDGVSERIQILEDKTDVPDKAIAAMRTALGTVLHLSTVDSFTAGAGQFLATARFSSSPQITLSNLYSIPKEQHFIGADMLDVALHEYLHVSGYVVGAGFLEKLFLEELIVAHLTAVAAHEGSAPNEFNPQRRPVKLVGQGTYQQERRFMGLTQQYGPVSLSLDDVVAGHYNLGTSGSARKHFLEAMNRNVKAVVPQYRNSGFKRFSQDYESHLHTHGYSSFMKRILKIIERNNGDDYELAA